MIRPVTDVCPPDDKRITRLILLGGLIAGISFFLYYYTHQLTLAHYDAKAHLLVARRIVDSLEPGYAQMGADWLPLTHLLYLPFVMFDSQYRTGFLPGLISVFAFTISGWLTYRISYRLTRSVAAGIFAAVLLLANPNLEYLQSCPLTEPLYMMLFLLAMDQLILWRESDRSTMPWLAALWVALGGVCRYEGWYLLAGVVLLLLYDGYKNYMSKRRAVKASALFLAIFAVPAGAHFGYIFYRLGDVFFSRVAAGNPDPYLTHKRPILSIAYHLGELSQMAAILSLLLAAGGVVLLFRQRKLFRSRAPLILLWVPSLINISALYWGLVYRLRYSVLLLPAVAVFGSLAITSMEGKKRGLFYLAMVAAGLPWISWYFPHMSPVFDLTPGPGALVLPVVGLILFMVAQIRQRYDWALVFLCILGMQLPLLDREYHPMMGETLEHDFIEPERQEVLRYLGQHYDDKRILVDMGKQAPLVYDSGLPVKDFVYNEGGEVLWHEAIRNPESQVGWLCAHKGDAVWNQLQVDPGWARAYALVVKTEYLSLYRLKS